MVLQNSKTKMRRKGKIKLKHKIQQTIDTITKELLFANPYKKLKRKTHLFTSLHIRASNFHIHGSHYYHIIHLYTSICLV